MVRNVDQESRKRAVLSATINRYIKEAAPVASEDIAEEFDLSSATIRNIFKELEEAGLLTHPYTSGGRVPTRKGYRYYVDFLVSQMVLLEQEKEFIGNKYKSQNRRLEDILEKTSGLVSAITHYTGIVAFLDEEQRLFYNGISLVLELPEFQDAGQIRRLVRMMENKQRLLDIINRDFTEKVKVYIGDELDCDDIEGCSMAVSRYSLNNRPLGRIAVLGPMRMEYGHIIPALEYVSDVLTETLGEI